MGEIELCVSVQFTCFLSFEDARCRFLSDIPDGHSPVFR